MSGKSTAEELAKFKLYGISYPWSMQDVLILIDRIESAEGVLSKLATKFHPFRDTLAIYIAGAKGHFDRFSLEPKREE